MSVPALRFKDEHRRDFPAWVSKTIGDVLTIGSGRDYKHLDLGNVPVYGTGGYMLAVSDYLYDGESVCIGRKGTIDKPTLLNGKFWTVDTLFYTHSFKHCLPKFVYACFQRIDWKNYNEASGVPSLSKSTIEKIDIHVPAIEEQTKIANFLTAVDERITQLSQKRELLAQYKKGVMQQIFSQELRFKDDEGQDFSEWQVKAVGDISVKKSSNIAANKIEDNEGLYKIYGAAGVLKKVDFFTEDKTYISIVKDGAGVGRTFLCEPYSSVLGTMDIIHAKDKVNISFLYAILEQIDFDKYVTGSTIPHIYYKDYSKETVSLPCLEEQTKIANFLSAIDDKLMHTQDQLAAAKQYKQGLLQQMFV